MHYQFTWVDGCRQTHIPVDDRGLHYGDGVFTTALVWEGKLVYADAHVQRLQHSARQLGLAAPSRWLLHSELKEAGALLGTGVIKYLLTRGSSSRGYAAGQGVPRRILLAAQLPERPQRLWQQGARLEISAVVLPMPAPLPGIKHLNCLPQVLASSARSHAADESVFLNAQGHIVGGSMSNLFFVQGGAVHTPGICNGGVDGIMRAQLLRAAARHGLYTRQGRYTLQDVANANEMFVSNAVIGLWPVCRLGGRSLPPGPVTRQLAQLCAHPLANQVLK